MQTPELAGTLISHLMRIPRKVWIAVAGLLLVLLVLSAWLAVTVVSRGWSTASALLDQRAAGMGDTARQHLQAIAPELGETLESGRAAAALIAPGISQQLEGVAPQLQQELDRGRQALALVAPGVAGQLERSLPPSLNSEGVGDPRDVPGEDIAGVPRHPALARTGYTLAGGKRTVTYAGSADFGQALSSHRDPLLAAGFSERILDSSPSGMTAEYRLGTRTLLLAVTAKGPASSEVRLEEL